MEIVKEMTANLWITSKMATDFLEIWVEIQQKKLFNMLFNFRLVEHDRDGLTVSTMLFW